QTSTEPAKEPAKDETATAGESARPADQADTRSASTQASSGLKSGTGFITDSSGKTRTFGGAEPPNPGASAESDVKSAAEGKVLAQGPGYTVTAGTSGANRPIRLAEATELKSPSGAPLERRYDPLVCQGNRLLQLNG